MAHGKKYLDAAKLVDRERVYPPDEAATLAKETNYVSFDADTTIVRRVRRWELERAVVR